MKKGLAVTSIFFILIFSLQVNASVGFSDFKVDLDDDDIDSGDDFLLELIFENPDATEDVDLEIEIEIGGLTIFHDEDYEVSFEEGIDKTVIIDSDDFPGADLDHDVWNDNLMKWECGDYDLDVYVDGDELDDSYYDYTNLEVGDGDDELTYTITPETPGMSSEIVITVFDEDDDELEDATVKLTWIEEGDEDNEWDSEDEKWEDETDSRGEIEVTLEDEFDDDALGEYQLDIYADDHCLLRDTFDITKELKIEFSTDEISIGEPFEVCVTNQAGESIYRAFLEIQGMGVIEEYSTFGDGCRKLSLPRVGTYIIAASKSDYESIQTSIEIKDDQVDTTTTSLASTTSTTTVVSTTTLSTTTTTMIQRLMVLPSKQTANIGESIVVVVKDQDGLVVTGVGVHVNPGDVIGLTNEFGAFSFSIQEEGIYTIIAEKSGYKSSQDNIEYVKPTPPPNQNEGGDKPTKNEGEDVGFFGRIIGFFKSLFGL